jgi:undecaprenyl diphosphate synthase
MDLFRQMLKNIEQRLDENRAEDKQSAPINVRIIGRRGDFAPDLIDQMNELEVKNAEYPNPTSTIWVALSYGGRAEIIEAVNQAIEQGEPVTEETFARHLWTADMPDPDLIVRTSGEQRLSNFVTWRSVYSELYFIEKHWPALTKADFADILQEYDRRERRTGI